MSEDVLKITDTDHVLGDRNAEFTLIEYGDYQCPGCGEAAPIVRKVIKHFGKKLRFAFRNFPLEQHEFAERAAETAEFAADQDKFWEMHDLLYKRQEEFSKELFPELAEELGLDPAELARDLKAKTYRVKVRDELKEGEAAGVPGTPAFFVNGTLWDGSYDFDSLVKAVEGKEGK